MVVVGLTVAQSFAFRLLPTPGMVIELAPVTCQHSLVLVPGEMNGGLATKVTTCGIPIPATVTVTGAVTDLPSALLAVRVYVVVADGDTVVLPFKVTGPTPLMLTVVAPLVVQLKVDWPPCAMVSGLASNLRICGVPVTTGTAVTVTVTFCVTVPFGPVAVSV